VTARSRAGLSSTLALALCSIVAVGAPPSKFVQQPSIWLRLEPMMLPALFGGVGLALLALLLAVFWGRGAALTCAGACAASMAGVIVAWGMNAEAGLRGLVLQMVLLALPALGAIEALWQAHREHRAGTEATSQENAR
jgi:hypothetical protein